MKCVSLANISDNLINNYPVTWFQYVFRLIITVEKAVQGQL